MARVIQLKSEFELLLVRSGRAARDCDLEVHLVIAGVIVLWIVVSEAEFKWQSVASECEVTARQSRIDGISFRFHNSRTGNRCCAVAVRLCIGSVGECDCLVIEGCLEGGTCLCSRCQCVHGCVVARVFDPVCHFRFVSFSCSFSRVVKAISTWSTIARLVGHVF